MSKFYKVTNKDELHCNGQYHDGLNEYFLPFTPEGDERERVGIQFTDRERVMQMFDLEFGRWIREVTLPEGEEIYTINSIPEKYMTSKVILGERKLWSDPVVFQALLDDGCDPSVNFNYIMQYACFYNLIEIVKLLLDDKRVDPTFFNYDYCPVITLAAIKGNIETVKVLLADKRVRATLSKADVDKYEKMVK